ncbi:MAG: bifunctional adenosylcobinamide kinase/adenosylcobinamide-phosphate guanylyltransferase [Campylobacterota bacterium]|nr:bifunctional adenosylcobinamide kinase/adenosylcobinamide-phosphate guanylyltransferase [Campylobacterota bacterium]
MKTLFIGGVKSGKSHHAENYILDNLKFNIHNSKLLPPVYLATSEPFDEEMKQKIEQHRADRSEHFLTIEEPLNLSASLEPVKSPVLIECMTVWMNNMLHHGFTQEDILKQIEKLIEVDHDLVFVLNDVGSGVIPDNALAREFVNLSGVVAQQLAAGCDEVYHCIAGIATKIK